MYLTVAIFHLLHFINLSHYRANRCVSKAKCTKCTWRRKPNDGDSAKPQLICLSFEFVVLGISPISSLLVGELFPLEYRGIGSSIATSFSYFCAFISVKTFIDFQVCAIDQLAVCAVGKNMSLLKLLFGFLLFRKYWVYTVRFGCTRVSHAVAYFLLWCACRKRRAKILMRWIQNTNERWQ